MRIHSLMILKSLFIFSTIIIVACEREGAGPYLSLGSQPDSFNLIFRDSDTIEIWSPKNRDTVSTEPKFRWKKTDAKFVFLGVFREPLEVGSKTITNSEHNVWAWYLGLGTGKEGNVDFSDGVRVKNDTLRVGESPTPLDENKWYYWAVWAWDNDGRKITYSSREMSMFVKK